MHIQSPLRPLTRRAEWRVKAELLRHLEHRAQAQRVVALPDWRARPYRVLYLRDDRIGDMLMSTGLLRALASTYPGFMIDVMTQPASAQVLVGNPYVRAVHVFHKFRRQLYPRAFWRLLHTRYDVVIDGMFVETRVHMTSLLLMSATGARYRVGIGERENGFFFNVPVPRPPRGMHHCEVYAAFAVPFGIAREDHDWRPQLYLADRERDTAERRWRSLGAGRRLFVNLSASVPQRRWPDECFIVALRQVRLAHPKLHLLVSGSPEEARSVQYVADAVGAVALPDVPLRQAFALVATADAVFTPDTSIAHAASAFNRPTVSMHPRHHVDFVPYRVPGRAVFSPDEAIAPIVPDAVIRALTDTLTELATDRAMPRTV